PGGVGGTVPEDINSSGTVVGYYLDAVGNAHAYSETNGVFTDIGPPGSTQTYAAGINDLGNTTGTFLDSDGIFKGWIFDGTSYQTVWLGSYTVVFDINEQHLATVIWQGQSGNYASSLYDGSNFTAINVPGAFETFARGISSAGNVALYWTDD